MHLSLPDHTEDGTDPAWCAGVGLLDAEPAEDVEPAADGLPDDDPPCGSDMLVVALDEAQLATLVARIVHQDQAALSALYDALSGRVYATALRITRRVALAEEVLQDCFWQVWRQAPRFDPERAGARAWVLNIARSRALDTLRRVRTEQAHEQVLLQREVEELPADPMHLLQQADDGGRLRETLAALDPLKRQLIALAYYRGLTQDEIARHTGMPLGTVKSHLRRTLAMLRKLLGAPDADGGLDPAA